MFKQFLPNKDWSFNLKGECKYKDIIFDLNGSEFLNIEISGIKKEFHLKWLSLISHYEVNLSLDDLMKINFIKCESRVLKFKCKHLMIFNSPIIVNGNERLIPGFTNFSINKDGVVRSLFKGKILSVKNGPYGYPYVNIYDADKCKWRSVSIHILLARAFIKNDDVEKKIFVNHIDGNKENFSPNNLEWVTSLKNNQHAFESGLRNDNVPCKVRDIYTNEVKEFNSFSKALNFIGISKLKNGLFKRINGSIKIPNLFCKKYEIKYLNDTDPWYYTLDNIHKDVMINKGPYQVKNIKTGYIVDCQTTKEVASILSCSSGTIQGILKNERNKIFNGFIIRCKTTEAWDEDCVEYRFNKIRKFNICDIFSDDKLHFQSKNSLLKFLKIDKKTLNNIMKKSCIYKNWKIEEV